MKQIQRIELIQSFWRKYQAQAWWLCWLVCLPIMLLLFLGIRYQVGINLSPSLPYSFFVVKRGEMQLNRGDLVAFRWRGSDLLPKGILLVKRVAAVPGDRAIYTQEAGWSANQYPVPPIQGQFKLVDGQGHALPFKDSEQHDIEALKVKSYSRSNRLMTPASIAQIPAEFWFVSADHADSLDSRYSDMGLMAASQIVGKVVFAW